MSGQEADPRPGQRNRKAGASKSQARHRARERAMQGVYQWLLSGASITTVSQALDLDEDGQGNADDALFAALLKGAISNAEELRSCFVPLLSRPLSELSPIEHAILLIATQELRDSLDVPYRVIINEAIELAKAYGGTDGHKFVNGVLDKAAARLRSPEVDAVRARKR